MFLAVAAQAILYISSTSTFTVVGDAQQYGNLFGVKPLAVCCSFDPLFKPNADNRGLFLIDLDIFTRQLMSGSRQYPDIAKNITMFGVPLIGDTTLGTLLYSMLHLEDELGQSTLHPRLHFTTSM